MLYDISPPLNEDLAVWPGDTRLEREVLFDVRRGDRQTLSTLHTTAHIGAHADAPSHFLLDAPSIAERPLDLYLGSCRLVRAAVRRGEQVRRDVLPSRLDAERLLFATGTFPDAKRFNEDFASLAPELIEELGNRGVRLVGIDTPSVDPFGSEDNPAHRACLSQRIAILEGLRLEGVPEGIYELIALPLRLAGFEASPVRAVLRSLP